MRRLSPCASLPALPSCSPCIHRLATRYRHHNMNATTVEPREHGETSPTRRNCVVSRPLHVTSASSPAVNALEDFVKSAKEESRSSRSASRTSPSWTTPPRLLERRRLASQQVHPSGAALPAACLRLSLDTEATRDDAEQRRLRRESLVCGPLRACLYTLRPLVDPTSLAAHSTHHLEMKEYHHVD